MQENTREFVFQITSELTFELRDTDGRSSIKSVAYGLKMDHNIDGDVYVDSQGTATLEGYKIMSLGFIRGLGAAFSSALMRGVIKDGEEERKRIKLEIEKSLKEISICEVARSVLKLESPSVYGYTTDKELVLDLEAINTDGRYDVLISHAKAGLYHAWKSSQDDPKGLLCEHLDAFPELEQIRDKILAGYYHEKPDPNDPEAMQAWEKKNILKPQQN